MTAVLAIDPGPETSGWVLLEDGRLWGGSPDEPNDEVLSLVGLTRDCPVACEWISNMGMQVGASVFETCYWAGRFGHAAALANRPFTRIKRIDVKKHLCGQTRANDANVRAALIDRFGGIGGKAAAVGVKASPGPLYGCRKHMWSALAVGVTYLDLREDPS